MDPEAFLGIWSGSAQNNNGWEMEITVSIPGPFAAGEVLGTYDIPTIPCTGKFRVLRVEGRRLDLRAEDQVGDCGEAGADSLELAPDGTLLYVSSGDGWEAGGTLNRRA